MTTAAQATLSKATAPAVRRAAPGVGPASGSPRYLRASVRLGGVNDPQEHEAEHAAGVIAAGGRFQVRDPGGAGHLRAAEEAARRKDGDATARRAVNPPVIDPGASGRVRSSPVTDARTVADPGGSVGLRRSHGPDPVRSAAGAMPKLVGGFTDAQAGARIEQARAASARPLPATVRARLEHGFGESMENVQVHTGPAARNAARGIGARAYTEGERITLGHGESEHDVRLMAHEATHVVQNRRSAGVPRALPAEPAAAGPARRSPDASPKTGARAAPAPAGEVRAEPEPIRRFGLDTILDKFADWANAIPGFTLLTVIIGRNPINGEHVDRSGANILRAAVALIPFGDLIVRALDTYGIFEKAGGWIDEQIASLKSIGGAIRDALMDFLDSLGLSDVIHPGDVWDRAKRIFTEPIDRIGAFFVSAAEGLVALVKDAILKPLAALASRTRAWDLLIAVLGHNPITGEEVPQTADTLIGGFMKLVGQEEIWENMKKANAVARAMAWFQKTKSGLIALVSQIPGLFIAALKSFKISDLLDLPGAIGRVLGMFGDFVGQFLSWAGNAVWDLLEIIFDVVSPGAFAYVKKTGAALKSILKHPLPFVGNLVKAAKLGLQNFSGNFLTHLKAGLIDWLTGSLPGVYIPQALTLPELGKFALSVLGISWAQIRAKIVKALGPNGEKIMAGLELAFDVVKALVSGGPAAAWDLIKEKLTGLKDMVIDGILGFVTGSIIKKAIPKLVSMFIPGAGFIGAIISIYDTVMVFVHKLAKIVAAVKAFVDSIVAIAAGQIGAAAARVESALAGILSLAISFLAGFLGLGNVADKVLGVIKKVQAFVDKALDTAIEWVVGKAKSLFAKLFGGKDKDKKDERTEEEKDKDKLAAIAEAEASVNLEDFDEISVKQKLGPIKSKYKLLTLDLEVESKTDEAEDFHFSASASKKISGKSEKGKTPQADGLKELSLTRPTWVKTKEFDIRVEIMRQHKAAASLDGKVSTAPKDIFRKDGTFKTSGKWARRHVLSSYDMKHHYETALIKPHKTIDTAGEALSARGFAPGSKQKGAIKPAAQALLSKFHNDASNLWVGETRENSRLQENVDASPSMYEKTGELRAKTLEKHIQNLANNYGIPGDVPVSVSKEEHVDIGTEYTVVDA